MFVMSHILGRSNPADRLKRRNDLLEFYHFVCYLDSAKLNASCRLDDHVIANGQLKPVGSKVIYLTRLSEINSDNLRLLGQIGLDG